MNDPLGPIDDASTPLSEEERQGLIPSYITLRGELNEAEQTNVLKAQSWAFSRKRNVLDQKFLNGLHKRMFGSVWSWAGVFRTTGKNIGVDAYRIANDLKQLTDDCAYWIEHETYSTDELATRFHHRLVAIHPYANGNGRHARLATDLLLQSIGQDPFSWGRTNLVNLGDTRAEYISALRAADCHDYAALIAFVRT